MCDLDPEGLQNRSDSFWDDVTSLLLQVGQLLRVHTAGDAGLQGVIGYTLLFCVFLLVVLSLISTSKSNILVTKLIAEIREICDINKKKSDESRNMYSLTIIVVGA